MDTLRAALWSPMYSSGIPWYTWGPQCIHCLFVGPNVYIGRGPQGSYCGPQCMDWEAQCIHLGSPMYTLCGPQCMGTHMDTLWFPMHALWIQLYTSGTAMYALGPIYGEDFPYMGGVRSLPTYGKTSHTWEDFPYIGILPMYGKTVYIWESLP
jgi:hypothetical protein